MSDVVIIKMIMGYAKHQEYYWLNTPNLEIENPRIKGDVVIFNVSYSNHYNDTCEIDLLDLLAWMYSNVK